MSCCSSRRATAELTWPARSDPETTGYFSTNDEGEIKFFALIPKKYSMTFVPQADGSWVIKDSSAKSEVAHKASDLQDAAVLFRDS